MLLVEQLNELLDDQYIEVVYSVLEDIYALVLYNCSLGQRLVDASVLGHELRVLVQTVCHLFFHYILCNFNQLCKVLSTLALRLYIA